MIYHDHANRILAKYPDRQAMIEEFSQVPEEHKKYVGRMVKTQQSMFNNDRYFAWCTVRPKRGERG